MPGCTSTLNYGVPGENSIQLFYNTTEQNLGLELMDGAAKPKDEGSNFVAGTAAQSGLIVDPSSLSTTQYQGTNFVVGITKPKLPSNQTDYTTYDVSIVSPVYQPLTSTEATNRSIAFSASRSDGWVTYISGTDKNNLTLNEYSLASQNTSPYPGTTKILYGSELAGYYHIAQDKHYVIYQGATGQLVEYCVDTQTPLPITNSNNSRAQTPMAVTLVGVNVYLYYTDSNYNICRIVKASDNWGSSSVLSKATVGPTSDLSVTTANSTNHLFYVAKNAAKNKFTHATDSLIG